MTKAEPGEASSQPENGAGDLRGRRLSSYRLGMTKTETVTEHLRAADSEAADRLLPLVYGELRKLAAQKLSRESPGQTLQATALVHEAWIRLGGDAQPRWENRGHFFAAAAEAMRRILIDKARRRKALRHGAGAEKIDLDSLELAAPGGDESLIAVDEALTALGKHDPGKAELVKLRYFAGLTIDETAQVLGISPATAKRQWAYARAWLYREISRQAENR